MIIFLRNIPEQTKHIDIIAFIDPAIKKRLFRTKGVIENIRVMRLKDPRTNISEYHGLVIIEPDAVAKSVIKRLNRKKFLRKYIAVREYQRRDWHNDPRINHDLSVSPKSDKRIGDRRRRNLEVVENITAGYYSEHGEQKY